MEDHSSDEVMYQSAVGEEAVSPPSYNEAVHDDAGLDFKPEDVLQFEIVVGVSFFPLPANVEMLLHQS